MKRYKVHTEFHKHNGKTYPVGYDFWCEDDKIYCDDGFMCMRGSQKARDCLIGNEDGKWKVRIKLVNEIKNLLHDCKNPNALYDRLEKLWNNKTALKYSRGGKIEEDAWLWNEDYFCASISDLKYIRDMLEEVTDDGNTGESA